MAGLSNGDLLAAAEAAGFEVIVTVDLRDLQKIVPAALEALASIKPGNVARIS
jgi:hypothetical protein